MGDHVRLGEQQMPLCGLQKPKTGKWPIQLLLKCFLDLEAQWPAALTPANSMVTPTMEGPDLLREAVHQLLLCVAELTADLDDLDCILSLSMRDAFAVGGSLSFLHNFLVFRRGLDAGPKAHRQVCTQLNLPHHIYVGMTFMLTEPAKGRDTSLPVCSATTDAILACRL